MIYRIIIYIIIFIASLSCSTGFIRFKDSVEPSEELEKYRHYLVKLSNNELGNSRKILLGFFKNNPEPDSEGNYVIGTCSFTLESFCGQIEINSLYWSQATFVQRILLLAHEYYHCQCMSLGHNNKILDDGCPSTYMSPKASSFECLNRHKLRYLKQLKKGCYLY